jgi:hypothetical protein
MPLGVPISAIWFEYQVLPSGSNLAMPEPFAMYVLLAASTAIIAAVMFFSYTRWAAGKEMPSSSVETARQWHPEPHAGVGATSFPRQVLASVREVRMSLGRNATAVVEDDLLRSGSPTHGVARSADRYPSRAVAGR